MIDYVKLQVHLPPKTVYKGVLPGDCVTLVYDKGKWHRYHGDEFTETSSPPQEVIEYFESLFGKTNE